MGKIYNLNIHKSPVSLLHCFFILSFHTENCCFTQFFYTYHHFLTDLLLLYFVPQSFSLYGIESFFLNFYSINKYTPFVSSMPVYFRNPYKNVSTLFFYKTCLQTRHYVTLH